MKAPGVTVRPLTEMTGESLFNEVFLDDVFVPDDLVVGEVGAGWKVARNTLSNERVSLSSARAAPARRPAELVGLARHGSAASHPGGARRARRGWSARGTRSARSACG